MYGVLAGASSSSGDTSPPTTPTNVGVSASTQSSLSLSWSASTDNVGVAGYGVYLNGARIGATTSTSYVFGSLSCGTVYTLGVDAYDAAGNRSAQASLSAQTSACSSTGGSTQTWLNPFASDSLWNTPLPASPAVNPNSGAMMSYFLANNIQYPGVSIHSFGTAVAVTNGNDPLYYVVCTIYSCPSLTAVNPVPIPSGTRPDPSSDGHLAVWNSSTHREYDFWISQCPTDCGHTGNGGSLVTDGANAGVNATTGGRAAGVPLLAGLLRPDDIAAGVIKHALVFTNNGNTRIGHVCPAGSDDGTVSDANALQEGMLLQLDPTLNVDALSLPPWEKTVAKALQTYGMYLTDKGGSGPGIYAEDTVNRSGTDPWTQLGSQGVVLNQYGNLSFSSSFPWNRLRVLMPPKPWC